jgi:hypothetical protein
VPKLAQCEVLGLKVFAIILSLVTIYLQKVLMKATVSLEDSIAKWLLNEIEQLEGPIK